MTKQVVRIKLGDEKRAPEDDDMGRDLIGYRDGLTADEIWERGRGCWKLSPERALEADLLVLTHSGRVLLVGSVRGITKASDGRHIIEGRPIPDHPLVGEADPWENKSLNPVAYGSWPESGVAPTTPRRNKPELFIPACAGGNCERCARCFGYPVYDNRAAFYRDFPQVGDGWSLEKNTAPGPLGTDVLCTTNGYLITIAHPNRRSPADTTQTPRTVVVAFRTTHAKIHVLGYDMSEPEVRHQWGHYDKELVFSQPHS